MSDHLSDPGSHDAHRPPRPVTGQTCKGCVNLRYTTTTVREGEKDRTTRGIFSCGRFTRITPVSETPRPKTEDCYRAKG